MRKLTCKPVTRSSLTKELHALSLNITIKEIVYYTISMNTILTA